MPAAVFGGGIAGVDLAHHLGIDVGKPILVMDQTIYDRNGRRLLSSKVGRGILAIKESEAVASTCAGLPSPAILFSAAR